MNYLLKSAMKNKLTILIAEDDDADYYLLRKAFEKGAIPNRLERVTDGDQLMSYLHQVKQPAISEYPAPGIILLDLNMPRKDGRECLREIKADPHFRKIPVIVLTTSGDQDDISISYSLGVNAYVQKPDRLEELVHALTAFKSFWLETVELPRT